MGGAARYVREGLRSGFVGGVGFPELVGSV